MNVRASGRQSGFSDRCHPACFACRPAMEGGLGLRFFPGPNGCVEARFACDGRYQGYPDRLHGGIVAMLLDAAMTHCLFAQQIRAFTAKLSLRYLHPVRVDEDCLIVACLRRRRGGLICSRRRSGKGGGSAPWPKRPFWPDRSRNSTGRIRWRRRAALVMLVDAPSGSSGGNNR